MEEDNREGEFKILLEASIEQFKEVAKFEMSEDNVKILADVLFNNIKMAVNEKEDSK